MNNFDMYSILFWEDKVFIDGHSYPLGQNATDALNIEAGTVEELRRTAEEFDAAALALVEKKDRDQASAVQEKLNAFLDILLACRHTGTCTSIRNSHTISFLPL